MHVIEIPPRSSLNFQRHVYEEKYWAIEGRGSTDVWIGDERSAKSFEWGSGSLFAIPLNASFSRHQRQLGAGHPACGQHCAADHGDHR